MTSVMRKNGAVLSDLAHRVSGLVVGTDPVVVRDVHVDPNDVRLGSLFVGLPRKAGDPMEELRTVVRNGAVAVCLERQVRGLPIPQLLVERPVRALSRLAATVHGDPSTLLDVVGITGTDGKTTVTYFLESIIAQSGGRPAVAGTIGIRDGNVQLPLPSRSPTAAHFQRLLGALVDRQVTTLTIEATSSALMHRHFDDTKFAVVAFTNLGRDHLDVHGSLDSYFAAKRRLFEEHSSRAKVIMIDDDHGRRLADRLGSSQIITASRNREADVWASDIVEAREVTSFQLHGVDSAPIKVDISMRGEHNVANAIVAAASALALGVDPASIVSGLTTAAGPPGRLEDVPTRPDEPMVLVDYAHTSQGVHAAISAASNLVSGRVIVVLGAGGDRDHGKRDELGRAASAANIVIVTSDNPRSEDAHTIAEQIAAGATTRAAELHIEVDRRAAIGLAIEIAEPEDVVLLLGKGHERTQESHGAKTPFDDRLVAREALDLR